MLIGFRQSGAASFFIDNDPVYQFNAAGQLRRAFVDGLLYKAQRGRLVSLRRDRSQSATRLLRRDLSDAAQSQFLATAEHHLTGLVEALDHGNYQIVGQVPPQANLLKPVRQAVAHLTPIQVAASPHVS